MTELNADGVKAAHAAIIGQPLNLEQVERIIRAYLASSGGEAVPVAWWWRVKMDGEWMAPSLSLTDPKLSRWPDKWDDSEVVPLFPAPIEGRETKVKALTAAEVEKIILSTEVQELSERGDRVWTRRMAEALARTLNTRILEAIDG